MPDLRSALPVSFKDALRPLRRRLRPASTAARPSNIPSDDEKYQTISDYASRFGCTALVETGTFEGGTVAAVGDGFERVFTIELNAELFRRAQRRFRRKRHVEVIAGDSSEELERLLPRLTEPTLFWLDAHYSRGGAPSAKGKHDPPLMFELGAILALRDARHVILIDDARCCGVEPGWPSYEELQATVRESPLELTIELRRDIVRIHRPES